MTGCTPRPACATGALVEFASPVAALARALAWASSRLAIPTPRDVPTPAPMARPIAKLSRATPSDTPISVPIAMPSPMREPEHWAGVDAPGVERFAEGRDGAA